MFLKEAPRRGPLLRPEINPDQGQKKMATILQTTFSNAFFYTKMCEF